MASLYLMEKKFKEGILVDVGSTTTDILPFGGEKIKFQTDFERLRSNNLVYTGWLRSPVNTIVNKVPVNGSLVPIASEFFAITADVYNILLGVDYTCETPDNRGKTMLDSKTRIARLLCADKDEVESRMQYVCEYIHIKQVEMISKAIEMISKKSGSRDVYAGGVGNKLALEAARSRGYTAIDLGDEFKDHWNLPCLGLVEILLDR